MSTNTARSLRKVSHGDLLSPSLYSTACAILCQPAVWWVNSAKQSRSILGERRRFDRSAALLDELGKRERELDDISEELLAADGRGLDARLREIEEFVQKRLQDIRGLLFADVPRAKAELSKHCTAITLTPEGSTFRITGDWNLLGGRSDGAGGGKWTERPPLHFECLAAA